MDSVSNSIHEVTMQITVLAKNNYGQVMFYPACELADKFARLFGQKTLTRANLEKIKDMEVAVVIKHEEVKI